MAKNKAQSPISSGNSKPPAVQKKPLAEVNFTATIMKISTAAAAKRVNSPTTSKMPPMSSVQPDQRAPEHSGRVSYPVEQRCIGGQAHAAERSEQLLHSVGNENGSEPYSQDRFGILVQSTVNPAERGNVKS